MAKNRKRASKEELAFDRQFATTILEKIALRPDDEDPIEFIKRIIWDVSEQMPDLNHSVIRMSFIKGVVLGVCGEIDVPTGAQQRLLKTSEEVKVPEVVLRLRKLDPHAMSAALRTSEEQGLKLRIVIGDQTVQPRPGLRRWEPIDLKELPRLTHRAITRVGYEYVHELQLTPRDQLAKVPQLGEKTLKAIENYLETLGVSLID